MGTICAEKRKEEPTKDHSFPPKADHLPPYICTQF